MERSDIQDHQFQRLLQVFPIVRSRDYCEEDPIASQSQQSDKPKHPSSEEVRPSRNAVTLPSDDGVFWRKLKETVEPQLGPEGAQRYCEAFRAVHKAMISRISPETAQTTIKSLEKFKEAQNN